MVSQSILGIRWVMIAPFHGLDLKANCRTYNIAQRKVVIGRVIISAFSFAFVVRYYRPFYLMSRVLK